MISPETVTALVGQYGLWVLAPAAVAEGPIVTVIAGWLARIGLLDLRAVFVLVVLADLAGDVVFYGLGRWVPLMPQRLRLRLGLNETRLDALAGHFHCRGGRSLVFGKLTHSAGALVLVAAGMARMPLGRFVFWNLAATLPKSALFLALGWGLGDAHALIGDWLATGSLVALGLIAALGLWSLHVRRLSA